MLFLVILSKRSGRFAAWYRASVFMVLLIKRVWIVYPKRTLLIIHTSIKKRGEKPLPFYSVFFNLILIYIHWYNFCHLLHSQWYTQSIPLLDLCHWPLHMKAMLWDYYTRLNCAFYLQCTSNVFILTQKYLYVKHFFHRL